MNPASDHPDTSLPPPPTRLLTFSSGGWVLLLAGFFSLVAAALVLYPAYANGFHRTIGDGRTVDSYGFDLSALTIPRTSLFASGNPKDGIHVIPESLVETDSPAQIDMIAKNERIRFLVPSDPVIGVEIAGVARCYPIRVLNRHELVNDTLGGTPIAITWSPLCGSVVVFDRRIDGLGKPPVEFGHSGLLVSSNTVFFDRRSDSKQESLWPQLALHAISGPKAGQPLTLLPYELQSWQNWRTEHPDTRVLLGLRSLKEDYGAEPYSTYLINDDLAFPVSPLWTNPHLPRKTPLHVTSTDATTWTATLPPPPSPAPPSSPTSPAAASAPTTHLPPPYRLHTYLFAWYAQHPPATDNSFLTR